MGGSANSLRSTFSETLSLPEPIAAGLDVGAGTWFCQFNIPLKPGPLNAANWLGDHDDTVWTADSAVAVGDTVSGLFSDGGEGGPVDKIDYQPPPFDVASRRGPLAQSFTGFPLTVT